MVDKEKNIVYKVIDKKTRYGSNAGMYLSCHSIREFKGLLNRNNLEKYFPKYEKGSIVRAAPNTIGILCFSSYWHSLNFLISIVHCHEDRGHFCIIKVKGIRRRKRKDPKIIKHCGSSPRYLGISDHNGTTSPPTGTVCFSAVKVLD